MEAYEKVKNLVDGYSNESTAYRVRPLRDANYIQTPSPSRQGPSRFGLHGEPLYNHSMIFCPLLYLL